MTRTISLVLTLGLCAPVLAQDPAATEDKPLARVEDKPVAFVEDTPVARVEDTPVARVEDTPLARAAEAAAAAVPGQVTQPASVEPSPSSWFHLRRVDIGVRGRDIDTESSRFDEYRAVPNGPVIPFARFKGEKDFAFDFVGEDMFRDDGRYRLKLDKGPVGVVAEFNQIPHRFGNEARSILSATGTVDEAVQQSLQDQITAQRGRSPASVNFAFLSGLVNPLVAQSSPFDVELQRHRGKLDVSLTQGKPVDVRLTYFHEERRGERQSGTAFGFGNVVETAEPIDYRTQDLGLSAEWARPWGLLRGGVRFNWFANANTVQTFDNPFRATDSTDASAYQAPGSASIGGAAVGRIALPPDNKSMTGTVGFAVKLAGRSRLTADASYGQWTQDEPFIPFTTNTAITSPLRATDVSTLPARSLDGRIDVFSFSSGFTTRPVDRLYLSARVRRYDLSNKTPRIEFHEGYVRFDGVWEEIPRISVPYGYTNDQAQLTASYDLGPVNVEGGYKLDRWERTFRETHDTTQNTVYASARLRAADWLVLRATAERGSRSYEAYHAEEAEHSSFLDPGPPANLTSLRRPDQAEKDLTRIVNQVQLSPGGNTTFALSYVRGKDDYKNLLHGLIDSENEAFTAEADYTPSERISVFGYYTRENISTFQVGRQSGATPSTNPLDDWTAAIDDEVDSFGGGANFGLVPSKLDLKLSGNYQKVDGNNDMFAPDGGAPANARRALGGVADILFFDDTKLLSLNAELVYKLNGGLQLALGGWFEDYEIKDANTSGLLNYVPGSLFLAPIDSDYQAKIVYGRVSYVW